jgi:hypothetical protein
MALFRTGSPVITDGAGRYSITGLPPGAIDLDVSADGFVQQTVPVVLVAGQTVVGNVALEPVGPIEISVRNAAGMPIADLDVSVQTPLLAVPLTATTDTEGRISFPGLSHGVYQVTLGPGVESTGTARTVTIDGSSPTPEIKFVIDVAEIRGRVRLGADGPPAPGVTVALIGQDRSLALDVADESGNYRFLAFAEGDYEVVATGPSIGVVRSGLLAIQFGDALDQVLDAGTASLTLHVSAPSIALEDVAGALVSIIVQDGQPLLNPVLNVADEHGDAKFPRLQPGLYRLRVDAPDLGTQLLDVSVPEDGATVTVALIEGRVLRGTLIDGRGAALPNVVVVAVAVDSRQQFFATSDLAGRYAFANLPSGRYNVAFSDERLRPEVVVNVDLASETVQAVDVILEDEGRKLRGVVTNVDGRIVPGALVSLVTADGVTLRSTIADEQGRYELDRLPDGELIVRAAGFGLDPVEQTTTNPAAEVTLAFVVPPPQAVGELRLPLGEGVHVTVPPHRHRIAEDAS